MENEKTYIVGFDLGRKYAQISYVSFEGDEGDIYNIPVCLCKRNNANQWFGGEEAQKFAAGGKGKLIDNLLQLALRGEMVTVDGQEMEPVDLLSLFIKNSLSRMGLYKENTKAKVCVLTVDELSEEMLAVLERMRHSALREFEEVYFESRTESLFYYIIHQPKELWSYEVGALDFSDGFLKLYRVEMNQKARPILTKITGQSYEELVIPENFTGITDRDQYLETMDEKLYNLMEEFLEGRIVTGIYLIGRIFEKEWYPRTLKLLCKNRRVFQGSNLYSKGACLYGMEKLSPGEAAKNYLYLGKEKLKADIGVLRMDQGKITTEVVLHGGVNWYEAETVFTFLPGEDYHLPVVIHPLDGSSERVVPIILPEFKNRDIKSLKFSCRLSMQSEKELLVEVEDIGFGAFFKPTGRKFTENISLGGEL